MNLPVLKEQKKFLLPFCGIILLSSCQSKNSLFKVIPSNKSGINFANNITENDSTNILDYEYIYNGGGVAVADFNKDGLPDLYFVANEVSNRLYLNRGNMKFRDVTKESATGGFNQWYTGVSIVDINADGLPDIYICASRSKNPEKRRNVLFVNQGVNKHGVPVFKDKAKEYGLASTAYSTQAAFFDYDNDGDLDMYEVVADKRGSKQRISYNQSEKNDPANVDRLYRCDWNDSLYHPLYTDVSKEAGINKQGYGLGVHVFDINGDGRKDIYVSDDYLSNDLLWINKGNGTFADRAGAYFKHTSFAGMGTDAGDINNDGLPDLVQLDMAGRSNYAKQTMYTPNISSHYFNNNLAGHTPEFTRNTLQLNRGKIPKGEDNLSHPIFSDISLMAGVARTNWSWGVLMADFNNDGLKDLIISNGIPKKINDKDFMKKRARIASVAPKSMLLDAIPAQKTSNIAFMNDGGLKFSNATKAWGLKKPSYSTGLVWADLDNDGDLDLVINNVNEKASVYENKLIDQKKNTLHHWLEIKFKGGPHNTMGLGARADIYYNSARTLCEAHQTTEHTIYRGYLSSVENITHFGLGKTSRIDSLIITWPQKKSEKKQILTNLQTNQLITVKTSDAKPRKATSHLLTKDNLSFFRDVTKKRKVDFVQKEKTYKKSYHDLKYQRALPHNLSQNGPAVVVGDVNADSLQDIFVAGSKNVTGTFLIQQPDGSFKEKDLLSGLSGAAGTDKKQQDEGVLLFDADNDGDLDLYIVSGGDESLPRSQNYQDRFFENDGKGHFTKLPHALPRFYGSGSVVTAADYDHDGDLDLFIGGRVKPKNYPKPVSCHILQNDSKNGMVKFTDVTDSVANPLLHIGLVTDALWSDYNNDGWPDLIISGEWMPITILKNQKGKKFINMTVPSGLANQVGWWNSLAAGDFDNDGDIDYIAGNQGTNTIFKVTQNEPVGIYARDFDNNGTYDAILTHFLPDVKGVAHEYPVESFNDFISQLPGIRKKIKSNHDYGKATLHDIFSDSELNDALTYHANHMKTSYLENNGNGTFTIKALPVLAQSAPVYGMVTGDFNTDGNLDVLLNGNDYRAGDQAGSYDALNGLLLTGNGKGGFTPQSMASSGVYIPGDGKALVKLAGANGKYLVAASQNKDPIKLFMLNKDTNIYPLQSMDASAVIQFRNGTSRKEEFYYGSSFLSASGRFMMITPEMESANITTYEGKTRFVKF